jgi:hypothetical protein
MNKHKILIVAIFTITSFFLVNCTKNIDNYELPNASISGALLDKQTNDTVQTANNTNAFGYNYPDGALNIYQVNYSKTASGPQGISYNQNGTYICKSLYDGTYTGKLAGAFYADEVTFEVKGDTKLDFKVTPFVNVTMQVISRTSTSITISYKGVSNDPTQKIQEMAAWISVSAGVNRLAWDGSNYNPIDYTTYRDQHENLNGNETFTRTFTKLKPGTTYFIRAGALATGNNPQNYWNYSKVLKFTTGN